MTRLANSFGVQRTKLGELGELIRVTTNDRVLLLGGLIIVSGIPRMLGAFLLPNAFGDAYVYIEDIERMSAKLSEGIFSITDTFGFWLPMYQFVCAVISAVVGYPFYVAKLVSAVCGTGVCVLVFAISLRVTGHLICSLLSFAIIALNPSHILYSGSALTDVPHAFVILISLYFVLEKRWIPAASFLAIAGLMRIEGWMFVALLPALQFLKQRRVSLLACVILMIAPVLWLYISWKATGNSFAYFEARNDYILELTAANPRLQSFSFSRVIADARVILGSTNPAVMTGCIIGAGLILKRVRLREHSSIPDDLFGITAASVYFFAFLGFLLAAYITGNQPDVWDRYGLILFAVGIPICVWTVLAIVRQKSSWTRMIVILVIAACLWQASLQLAYAVGFINRVSTQTIIANYLQERYQVDPNFSVLCDDGTVRALSKIPPERFVLSSSSPDEPESFLRHLNENRVEYIVHMAPADSNLVRLFPELANGVGNEYFRPVIRASSKYWRTDIWLYRMSR